MLLINKQMLRQLTFPPCFQERVFCRAAWRLWQTLITGVLLSWITKDREKKNNEEERTKTFIFLNDSSVFQPYVKHRLLAAVPLAKDPSVFQMSLREQCLWNQFCASLEMAAERDCRRGWDVVARHQSLSPGRTCDLQNSRRRKRWGFLLLFFFFWFHVCRVRQDGGDASVWPRERGSRRATSSLPDMIDTI